MGFQRFFGIYFTDTCISIAEAYLGRRDNQLQGEVIEQANYQLEPEWLSLFKDAIPNLYDTKNKVYGFAALADVWHYSDPHRFLRFNPHFFEQALKDNPDNSKLINLFRYCQVFHIRPQSDEELVVTLVIEQLEESIRRQLGDWLDPLLAKADMAFVDVIDVAGACRCHLQYAEAIQKDAQAKMLLLVHLGYTQTLMLAWDQGRPFGQPVQAPGMRSFDEKIANYCVERAGQKTSVHQAGLLLYAQRARRAFEASQSIIKLTKDDTCDLRRSLYETTLEDDLTKIARCLEETLRGSANLARPIDEVWLTGEGANFLLVQQRLKKVCDKVPLRILPQPTSAVAKGAASHSWQAKN